MSGTLGKLDLSANVDTVLYSTNVNEVATLTLSVCNRGASETFIYVAISGSDTPANSDYIEFNTILPPFGVLERTGVVLSGGDKVVVRSETDDVSVVAYGFEDLL